MFFYIVTHQIQRHYEKKNSLSGMPLHAQWRCYSLGSASAEGLGKPRDSSHPLRGELQEEVPERHVHWRPLRRDRTFLVGTEGLEADNETD